MMSIVADRPLPHNLEAEAAVLGACLMDPDAFSKASAVLAPRDFFRSAHQLIFETLPVLRDRGLPTNDMLMLRDELGRTGALEDVGGASYLCALTDGVPHSLNVEYYARIVLEKSKARHAVVTLNKTIRHVLDGDRQLALADLRSLLDDSALGPNDEPLLEPAAVVGARAETERPKELIRGLLFASMIALFFGLERTFKSLAKRELAVALASGPGRSLFGLGRLAILEQVAVAYVTEEDSAGAVFEHLDAFSNGQVGRGELPLYLSACKGITVDDARTQDRIIRDVGMCGARLTILEPCRSLTACVDQGPRELQPFTAFVRRLIRETGTAVLLGHHAVKPVAGYDNRKGSQRVSGGGLLSIAETPVEFTRIDDMTVLFTPRGFKHIATPEPIQLRLETQGGVVSRLVADEFAPPPSEQQEAESRVLEAVRNDPGLSSSAIATRVKGRKGAVLEAVRLLGQNGRLKGVQEGKATKWYPA
ncbi:MAG: DnaB-like helicase N-terminal domain-containing protein [Vicinamibacterales bacterium]